MTWYLRLQILKHLLRGCRSMTLSLPNATPKKFLNNLLTFICFREEVEGYSNSIPITNRWFEFKPWVIECDNETSVCMSINVEPSPSMQANAQGVLVKDKSRSMRASSDLPLLQPKQAHLRVYGSNRLRWRCFHENECLQSPVSDYHKRCGIQWIENFQGRSDTEELSQLLQ